MKGCVIVECKMAAEGAITEQVKLKYLIHKQGEKKLLKMLEVAKHYFKFKIPKGQLKEAQQLRVKCRQTNSKRN